MQHEEGPDFPADAKPAQTVLEGHGGSQSWLWTIHTAFLEFLLFPKPCQAFPGKALMGTPQLYDGRHCQFSRVHS